MHFIGDLRGNDNAAAAHLLKLYEDTGTGLQPLFDAVVSGSAFLTSLLLRFPDFSAACFSRSVEDTLAELLQALEQSEHAAMEPPEVMRLLRQTRYKAALVLALADIAEVVPGEEIIRQLSLVADGCVSLAVSHLLHQAAQRGSYLPQSMENLQDRCGYVILAMGKHGACELNYSSDIDLIVFYDPVAGQLGENTEPGKFFIRLTRQLVSLLQDMTEDGFAYRVDLRLRPDPAATQVAISIEAAAVYYENMGQNWERAAMIKARPIAGELALGHEFLDRLQAYVWRKYLDFAAIADVQSMKRQIHAVKGHGAVKVAGHNVKLGRGGIREIEFFVQTQQLIAGGRMPELRGSRTLAMLPALANAGWIEAETAQQLSSAYLYLRRIEHRLQMMEDTQTHNLPENAEKLAEFARFAGYENLPAFESEMLSVLETVQAHYAALFEEADELGLEQGSLVFTGADDDPGTLETLSGLGFANPQQVSATIRGWHFGRYAATRAAKTRERLTEIMPVLLKAIADAGDADQVFIAFDRFLAKLPTGLQLFSMLRANPHILELLLLILGTAPRAAEQLSRRSRVLDAVLDADFFDHLPNAEETSHAITAAVGMDVPVEEAFDQARIIGKELQFRIDVRLLSQTIDPLLAGKSYSMIADALLIRLLAVVRRDFEARHGNVPGGAMAILGMGKLGSCELSSASDLDLIVIYDFDADATQSDGLKPLSPNQYYARLTQRLITAISSPTSQGVLYEVDMRLRPSGNKGPAATSFAAFEQYQYDSAWTWEKLAMVRARIITGQDELAERIHHILGASRTSLPDATAVLRDTAEMRQRIFSQHGSEDAWQIKHARGGLIDIEFIAQALQLVNDGQPVISNTAEALSVLAQNGAVTRGDKDYLMSAYRDYHTINQILALCVTKRSFAVDSCPSGLERLLCALMAEPNLSAVTARLSAHQSQVKQIFTNYIGAY